MFPIKPKQYKDMREQLINIGIHMDVVEHLDTLEPKEQEEVSSMFMEIANDELLFILSIKDLDFVKNKIDSDFGDKPILH